MAEAEYFRLASSGSKQKRARQVLRGVVKIASIGAIGTMYVNDFTQFFHFSIVKHLNPLIQ